MLLRVLQRNLGIFCNGVGVCTRCDESMIKKGVTPKLCLKIQKLKVVKLSKLVFYAIQSYQKQLGVTYGMQNYSDV